MKFESVKCDECGRIQDAANHWLKMVVWRTGSTDTIAIGPYAEGLSMASIDPRDLDLCGQGCAMKHIAKLLGWSSVLEAQKD